MAYREATFQSEFSKWLRNKHRTIHEPENKDVKALIYNKTLALELKLAKDKKRVNYKTHFQPQQLPSLEKAKHGHIYHKISDLDPGSKPFDCFQIAKADAYVVICWYKPRSHKHVYFIDIEAILLHKQKNKSLTEEDANNIATYKTDFM